MSQLTDCHWEYHRQAVPSIPISSSWSFPSHHLPSFHPFTTLPMLPFLPVPYIPLILSSSFPSLSHLLPPFSYFPIRPDTLNYPILSHSFPSLIFLFILSHPLPSLLIHFHCLHSFPSLPIPTFPPNFPAPLPSRSFQPLPIFPIPSHSFRCLPSLPIPCHLHPFRSLSILIPPDPLVSSSLPIS